MRATSIRITKYIATQTTGGADRAGDRQAAPRQYGGSGRTPVLSRSEPERIGYRLAIYPATGFLAMAHALEAVYGAIRQGGASGAVTDQLADFQACSELMGFKDIWAFETRYAEE